MTTINSRDKGSFRDPSGFLFYEKGEPYRMVAPAYKAQYDHLMSSGLYEALVGKNLLLPHEELREALQRMQGAYKILKPRVIPFISYPYEWCFSQLKAAALATLAVQKIALRFGMTLKDASCYNIQFFKGKAMFIDTLSFDFHKEGTPWVAYGQFCRHFLAPLALMSERDVRLSQLMRVFIDGIPLDLASSLLPFSSNFKPSLLSHLRIHAAFQKRYEKGAEKKKTPRLSKAQLAAFLESLKDAVEGLKLSSKRSEWGEYYGETNYSSQAFQAKKDFIKAVVEEISPKTVWDLGANTGVFSRIASGNGVSTVAFDIDHETVEKNWHEVKMRKETNLLPLLMDFTNPSSSLGWAGEERMSLAERGPADMVFALALLHHLAISNNVPFGEIAKFLSRICSALVIEFVPKEDSNAQFLLRSRDDIFPSYTKEHFEEAFSQFFRIIRQEQVIDSHRILYLMKKI
ncbi:MAG: SAM-dependent methyltransferase [Parcubacteria group bacterium]|nr:SAM-dependent methyltransferase [Parcubacteria group bacterium]